MKLLTLILTIAIIFSCSQKHSNKTHFKQHKFLHDKLLASMQPQTIKFEIDPQFDTVITLNKRGTRLLIPANCFVNEKKVTISEKVTIEFKEFTNSADIAFSGINMQFKKDGEQFNFNSSGMFEINGSAAGSRIDLKKGKVLTLDYALTQNVPKTQFYKLNKDNSNWKLIQNIPTLKETLAPIHLTQTDESKIIDITFEDPSSCLEITKYKDVRFQIDDEESISNKQKTNLYYQVALEKTTKYGVYLLKLGGYDENANFITESYHVRPLLNDENFNDANANYEAIFQKAEISALAYLRELEEKELAEAKRQQKENDAYDQQLLFEKKLNDELIRLENEKIAKAPFVSAEYFDPGHTYPAIVEGLKIAEFGIYNCDQLYRFQEKTNLSPIYLTQHGKRIENGYVLSVIDLKLKAAFSFDPNLITIDKSSSYVLALFTKDKRLFLVKSDLVNTLQPNETGETLLKMTEVTSKIKTSDDLRIYLGV